MRRPALAVVAGAIVLSLAAAELPACGDKYLAVGRGTRFQRRYISLRPVSILVLARASTGQKEFLSRLKLAGHRVESAKDIEALGARLNAANFDVVLADYDDAAAVNRSIQKRTAKPLFLPVVQSGSPHAAAAHREYGCLLKGNAASKQHNFLSVLDQAVDANRKSKPVQCEL